MKKQYVMKPEFEKRMRALLQDEKDFGKYLDIARQKPQNFIRCNTIKIGVKELLEKLRKRWVVEQPHPSNPEILLVKSQLNPGELGNSLEHLLGHYYIQDLSSMLPPIALEPQEKELILDLFASPGSKTTQIASYMKNQGTIIANDVRIDRIKILVSNIEKLGVTNTITTRKDAMQLCAQLKKAKYKFDRILLDVPCSGEGTLRSSPKTLIMWNEKVIKSFSKQQKRFFASAISLLKKGGTLVYSTCTHAPEENEEAINFALKNFPLKIETLSLPVKCRPGITEWKNKDYNKNVNKACRIYPQDNDSEGFFLAKFTLLEEVA